MSILATLLSLVLIGYGATLLPNVWWVLWLGVYASLIALGLWTDDEAAVKIGGVLCGATALTVLSRLGLSSVDAWTLAAVIIWTVAAFLVLTTEGGLIAGLALCTTAACFIIFAVVKAELWLILSELAALVGWGVAGGGSLLRVGRSGDAGDGARSLGGAFGGRLVHTLRHGPVWAVRRCRRKRR